MLPVAGKASALSARHAKLDMDLRSGLRLVSSHTPEASFMAPHTDDLIRQLCTRIGMIMEDEAATGLVWDPASELTMAQRLQRLEETARAISALAEAAKVLSRAL